MSIVHIVMFILIIFGTLLVAIGIWLESYEKEEKNREKLQRIPFIGKLAKYCYRKGWYRQINA